MRCLVTGSCGFIGSHLSESLLKDGHTVIGMDNLLTNRLDNLERLEWHKHFTFANVDITHENKIDLWMRNIDIVFHQAASKKNVCLDDPKRDLDVNGKGTLILLEAAKQHGVKKFIHASTGSVYGEQTGLITENSSLNPCSYYGVSKLAGERYVNLYQQMGWLDTTILRYFHVFGEHQDNVDELGGVIAIFIKKAMTNQPITIYGDGTQIRSFTYVKDVVKANRAMVDVKSGVYNVASGIKVSIQDLAKQIIKKTKSNSEIKYADWLVGDIRDFNVDNTKIAKFVKFTPFKTGLSNVIKQGIRDFKRSSCMA